MGIKKTTKVLGVFSLAMLTAVSVDSVRNLPATALFGSSLIFFFFFGTLFFLLPSALVSAELSSCSEEQAGIFSWVEAAFNGRVGFIAVWFQWIENVIWYPTILSFVAGTIGYLILPSLAGTKTFLITVILCAFWGVTLINLMGIKASAFFGNLCAILGLIVPMSLIISLGAAWLLSGRPMQIHFTLATMFLHPFNSHVWVALTGVILSFCGMEIATVHSEYVRDPQRSYPRAMLIAASLIVLTLLCGALSIAIVLPENQISLVAGIMQAFHTFFKQYHIGWLFPFVALMLVMGGMGGVNNWVIAPTRGLLMAAKKGYLPNHMKFENSYGAPVALLLYQAVIVTIVSMVFFFMPTVNGSYWLLTVLASQLYMIMYILMFVSAIRLRYVKNARQKEKNGFKIPGGKYWGMWVVAGLGIFGAATTLLIGFIPPVPIQVGGELRYEELLLTGLLLMSLPPFLLFLFERKLVFSRENASH